MINDKIIGQYKFQLAHLQQVQFTQQKQVIMDFLPLTSNLSSHIVSAQKVHKNTNTFDDICLYQTLTTILTTLQAQKQQFQDRTTLQKRDLQQKVAMQEQRINSLEKQMESLEEQCKKLRFNYHQRGSVVDYLKKKVKVIEGKFSLQKDEILYVIKYLENRNSQLNDIIYELKNKELELNQSIFTLQEKYFHLSNDICAKNVPPKLPPKMNTKRSNQRASLSTKQNTASFTPSTLPNKYNNENILHTDRSNNFNLNSFLFDDNNNEQLADSSIREKTVKYQNTITRARSEDEIDFAQLNHIVNLGRNKQNKSTDIHQHPGKRILINNYGHLNFSEYPLGQKNGNTRRQKHNYVVKPKLSLPNHGRYVTQLNTKRTNKEIGRTSIQF